MTPARCHDGATPPRARGAIHAPPLNPARRLVGPTLAVGFLALGCGELTGGAGDRPDGYRLVEGSLSADPAQLGPRTTGVQLAALAIKNDDVTPYVSDVLDPSAGASASVSFSVPVKRTQAFVFVLQVPSASGQGPGALIAALSFPDGTGEGSLVPAGKPDLDLGSVTLTSTAGAAGGLVIGDAQNPLAQVDTDGDESPDASDTDDDADGTLDADDPDRAGDGVDDAAQLLSSLPDDDDDGTPDALE